MIELKYLTKHRLIQFVESDVFQYLPVIPITKHRAYSYYNCPSCNDTDIVLITAWIHNEMVGYLGILPDTISIKNNFNKCGWLSCIWTSANHRGQGIAKQLVLAAFESWNNQILLAEYTPEAGALYLKLNLFYDAFTIIGNRLYFRCSLATIMLKKKPAFTFLKPFFLIIDFCSNMVIDAINHFRKNANQLFYLEETDFNLEKNKNFTNTNIPKNALFHRKLEDLKWIQNNPWVLNLSEKNSEAVRYFFSSFDSNCFIKCINVFLNDKTLIGILLLSQRNGHLKVSYCYSEKKNDLYIAKAILNFAFQNKISTLSVFNPDLADLISQNKNHAFYTKKINRTYLFSKSLIDPFNDEIASMQDGDGDCAFT